MDCLNYKTDDCGFVTLPKDSNPGIICGDGLEEDYDNVDVCYINSTEDLIEFSTMVNNGYSFENKNVQLMYNIDIADSKLYSDVTNKFFGDINGDGVTNNINDELQSYFPIIGTSSNPFKGTFDGNGYTISNVKITGNNYVGMFGYNEGVIRGFNVQNIEVVGNENIAGIVADNKGTVEMINMQGTITGNKYVGGIVSKGNYSSSVVKNVIVNAEITSSENAAGLVYVGRDIYGIIEGGGMYTKVYGYVTHGSGNIVKTAYLSNVIYNSALSGSTLLHESLYNDLSAYSTYITTSLSGTDEMDITMIIIPIIVIL